MNATEREDHERQMAATYKLTALIERIAVALEKIAKSQRRAHGDDD